MEAKKQRMSELIEKLNEASKAYYAEDREIMSNFEYDALFRELEQLEEQYPEFDSELSPTKRVGGIALDSFEEVEHKVPMESINDVFSFEELREFDNRIKGLLPGEISDEYVVETDENGK